MNPIGKSIVRPAITLLIGGLLILGGIAMWTAGKTPYDPRPLMADLQDRQQGKSADSMHFLVFGDGKTYAPFPSVLKRADSLSPDFCLSTGDLVQNGGGPAGQIDYERLANQGGWFFRKVPTWPAVGNHELRGGQDGMANFTSFFGIETSHYSFTHGNAKFIALPWQEVDRDSDMLRWLEDELKAASGKHVFVFGHRPYFTVGSKPRAEVPGQSSKVTDLFAKHGVLAVFSGHEHIYYRTRRQGVHYIISAGAGATLYPLSRESEAIEGDVYFGAEKTTEEGAKPAGYRFHFADGRPDLHRAKPVYYVVSIRIAGPEVTLRMIDAAEGKVWDEVVLAPR